MKIPPPFLRRLLLPCLLALAAGLPGRASAIYTFTLMQTGGNVVVSGTGTLNPTALSLQGTSNGVSRIDPAMAVLFAGPTGNNSVSFYLGTSGPSNFGPGTGGSFPFNSGTNASSGNGSEVGLNGGGALFIATGYVAGTPLTSNNTYTGATFASLGFTPGTYTYTWGSGTTADSLIVTSVVPEPGTWGLFVVGGVGLLGLCLRRRQVGPA